MKLECVIVSVNYADYLAHTLPMNRPLFDRIVVVTSPSDADTKRVCEFYHVQCVATGAFYRDGAKFRKGAGINVGLQACDRNGWLCHMDADIVLPPLTRHYLEIAKLDTKSIYGIDRMMCHSYATWAAFIARPQLQHEQDVFIQPRPWPIGTRLSRRCHGGYLPIGFFQLWHADSGIVNYPEEAKGGDHDDVVFCLNWPRERRHLFADVIGYHLATEDQDVKMGENWNGRKTRPFGPDVASNKPASDAALYRDSEAAWPERADAVHAEIGSEGIGDRDNPTNKTGCLPGGRTVKITKDGVNWLRSQFSGY